MRSGRLFPCTGLVLCHGATKSSSTTGLGSFTFAVSRSFCGKTGCVAVHMRQARPARRLAATTPATNTDRRCHFRRCFEPTAGRRHFLRLNRLPVRSVRIQVRDRGWPSPNNWRLFLSRPPPTHLEIADRRDLSIQTLAIRSRLGLFYGCVKLRSQRLERSANSHAGGADTRRPQSLGQRPSVQPLVVTELDDSAFLR